jgi:hypothetical protein
VLASSYGRKLGSGLRRRLVTRSMFPTRLLNWC